MPTFPTGRVTPAWAPLHAKSPAYMQELAEITAEQKRMEREFLLIKRRIAWNRVIDEAIKVARLLGELEVQEALKSWRDQPRVPAGNTDGGQGTDGGGGGAAASSDEGRVISDANPDNFWRPGSQLAQADLPIYRVDLRDHEGRLDAHAIAEHVGRSDAYLLARARGERGPVAVRKRVGTFPSMDAATSWSARRSPATRLKPASPIAIESALHASRGEK